ncbi:hypothetical protein HPB51_023191 [Rhipicephalus microplus]|uniref:Uncharacterized protein n=1 Tax=Rhipicephalus microplus TaxID=6941 RepID=A0A9J6DK47_RHIMP|nr:hypothetical protein HPB51_023191 [Rhipicephalus microplus]
MPVCASSGKMACVALLGRTVVRSNGSPWPESAAGPFTIPWPCSTAACSRQWVAPRGLRQRIRSGEQQEEQPDDDPPEIEEPRETLLVPYYEEFDTRVVLAKMEAMRVNRALVVYGRRVRYAHAAIAISHCRKSTYAMDTFRHQTERLNLTLAFVPLEANRTRVLEAINHTLRRMSRKNTFYTSFVMLVFANFTLAERLEAELVTHIGLNPNMRLLLFYNGWDKSLGRWYYQHEITCTFEKQIYVITRAHIGDTRDIMMTASANWGSHDHVFTMPDISTLVFIHYVILYTSHQARNLPESTACGTPMDDVLEGMKQNITTEVKRLSVHRSTARYRTFFLAPVTSKEYRLKLIENWKLKNASLERTVLLDEVDAYLRNRTINVAILEFPPYAIYHKEQGGSITCNGTFLHFMNYLQEIFGFNDNAGDKEDFRLKVEGWCYQQKKKSVSTARERRRVLQSQRVGSRRVTGEKVWCLESGQLKTRGFLDENLRGQRIDNNAGL